MKKLKPKYVKRANQWCVTVFEQGDKKEKQTVEWFGDEKSALEFYNKK
jgi:hypothetical protein